MNWLDEVQDKVNRKNLVLFDKNSKFLSDLTTLIKEQNHRPIIILWAFEFADETVQKLLKRYPREKRLESAVLTSKNWAAGKVKMPIAQRAILQAHATAKEIESPEDIALCHAIGQACSVVHTNKHAIGFPIYDLTAIVRAHGVPECKKVVEQRKQEYMERLDYWQRNYKLLPHKWADFIVKS